MQFTMFTIIQAYNGIRRQLGGTNPYESTLTNQQAAQSESTLMESEEGK